MANVVSDLTSSRLKALLAKENSSSTSHRFDWWPRRYDFPFGPRWLFGISISGAIVTVYAGGYRRAGQISGSPQATVTIAADHQFIGYTFDPAAGTLIISPTPFDTIPADASGKIQGPLYQMRYQIIGDRSARVSLEKVWQMGIVNTSEFEAP